LVFFLLIFLYITCLHGDVSNITHVNNNIYYIPNTYIYNMYACMYVHRRAKVVTHTYARSIREIIAARRVWFVFTFVRLPPAPVQLTSVSLKYLLLYPHFGFVKSKFIQYIYIYLNTIIAWTVNVYIEMIAMLVNIVTVCTDDQHEDADEWFSINKLHDILVVLSNK